MSRQKVGLIGSCAAALLALSFALWPVASSAEDFTSTCSTSTSILDNTADVAEALDLLCHSYSAEDDALTTGTVRSDAEFLSSTIVEIVEEAAPELAVEIESPATEIGNEPESEVLPDQ
jgi:hypothetical protein